MMKDAGLRIRIDRQLREKFIALCRAQDRPASQVIREFMREYVDRHGATNDSGAKANVNKASK
jgi:predicted transcriptional regulator